MKLAQRLQKRASAAAPAVLIEGKMLQKDQQAKHVGISRFRHAEFPLLAASVFIEPSLKRVEDCSGQRISGPALVMDAALQGAVSTNQAIQRLRDIAIDHAGYLHGRLEDRFGEENEQRLVVPQQLFGDLYVPVRKVGARRRLRLFVPASLPEELAIERAVYRNLAFGAATDRTNIAVHARTEPARTAGVTNCARQFLSIEAG